MIIQEDTIKVNIYPVPSPNIKIQTEEGMTVIAQTKTLNTKIEVTSGLNIKINTNPRLLAMMVVLS